MKPFFSIIMNCYNGKRYLKEAIDSVYAQTYDNWEIIFWDNQSTDQSAKVFKSYNDPRLKYHYAPTHTFLAEARNYAIEKARGEFIAFLDVDDWWYSEKLEKQLLLFADPQVGFVCCKAWVFLEKQGIRKPIHKGSIPTGWVLNDILDDYSLIMSTIVLRRVAFDSLEGGFDNCFNILEDWDLMMRLAIKWKLDCCQEPLADYRMHGENIILTQRVRRLEELQLMMNKIEKNPDLRRQPLLMNLKNEIIYSQGRLCLNQRNRYGALSYLNDLPWGKFKIKLWIWFIMPKSLLRMVRLYWLD